MTLSLPMSPSQTLFIPKGAHVFRQGDRVLGLYELLSGRIQMHRHTEDGAQLGVFTANAGQTFAEAALFSPVYHCDAVALEDCEVHRFDKDAVLNALAQDPTEFLRHMAHQIQNLRQKAEIVAIRSAKARVLAAISAGLLQGDIKSLASEINLTPEATYRALSGLTQEGALQKTGRGAYRLRHPLKSNEIPNTLKKP